MLSIAEGWYEKREGGRQRLIQLVVVISIGTANENVDLPGVRASTVSKHGRDLDVTFFPSCLHGITSWPVENSTHSMFEPWSYSLFWTLFARRYWTRKELKRARLWGGGGGVL